MSSNSYVQKKQTKTIVDLIPALKDADQFIENSCLKGCDYWSQSDVIVALNYSHEFALHPFFQDPSNYPLFKEIGERCMYNHISELRGQNGINIANTLMTIEPFRKTKTALDLDFLTYSFDGVNTPGMFAMVLAEPEWFLSVQHKNNIGFAELLNKIYKAPISDDSLFVLSFSLSKFLLDIEDIFEFQTKRALQLFASFEYVNNDQIKSPIDFVKHQIEVLSVLNITEKLSNELHDNFQVSVSKPDVDFFVESIEALKAFNPLIKNDIINVLLEYSEKFLLPDDAKIYITHSKNELELSKSVVLDDVQQNNSSSSLQLY